MKSPIIKIPTGPSSKHGRSYHFALTCVHLKGHLAYKIVISLTMVESRILLPEAYLLDEISSFYAHCQERIGLDLQKASGVFGTILRVL
jgi:hypothetical protein